MQSCTSRKATFRSLATASLKSASRTSFRCGSSWRKAAPTLRAWRTCPLNRAGRAKKRRTAWASANLPTICKLAASAIQVTLSAYNENL